MHIKRLLGIIFFLFLAYRIYLFFAVDACLDRGGRWNYDENICEASASF